MGAGRKDRPARRRPRSSRTSRAGAVLCLLAVTLAGCAGTTTDAGSTEITIWHHGGQPKERALLADQVERFNTRSSRVHARVIEIAEAEYPDRVQLAAVTGELPDLLDLDGPSTMNYVYQQQLRPLNGLLSANVRADLTESIRSQGSHDGQLYSVGAIDSGLCLYASRRALNAVGAGVPRSWADAWTAAEFEGILKRLAARDPDGRVLDVALNYGIGEWYTYAFAPIVWSAGGNLMRDGQTSDVKHTLVLPAVATALDRFGGWVRRYVDPNDRPTQDAFTTGRVALSWGGHWRYADYRAALGDDLVILPLPDFGLGAKTGAGSWAWGITTVSKHPEAAAQFLDMLMSTDEVLAASQASGAPPGTTSAFRSSPAYAPGGPLSLFAEALSGACGARAAVGCTAVSRPPSAAYPVITNAFQDVIKTVLAGGEALPALERAASLIDHDYTENAGYRVERP